MDRNQFDVNQYLEFYETDQLANEFIEDEPEKIDLVQIFKIFFKYWKILLILMFVCGGVLGYLRPGKSSTIIGAQCTLYIPGTTYRMVDGERLVTSNNLSQVENALGLITSKVYRDQVASELGTDSISDYGTYSVYQQDDTELITIDAVSSNYDQAEKLCSAVVKVFQDSVGKTVSINDMLMVDPVQTYSNITVTSTLASVFRGMIIGSGIYCIFVAYKYFTDRTFHSKNEAEEYLEIPVLCVLPKFENNN